METFRIEVGSIHGIKPGNIVGAIANEADIEGVLIGRVDIREDHSYVDLPEGMPKEIFKQFRRCAWPAANCGSAALLRNLRNRRARRSGVTSVRVRAKRGLRSRR